jgi:hypothetical protein
MQKILYPLLWYFTVAPKNLHHIKIPQITRTLYLKYSSHLKHSI